MRRFVPIIFFIAIFGAAPSAVSAQLMRGNVPIGAGGAARGYQVPTQAFPGMTACDSNPWSRLRVESYVGYLDDPNGFSYNRERSDASGEPSQLYSMPVRGMWLGLSSGISLSDALGITLSGGLLVPGKTQGQFSEDGAVQVALNSNLDSNHQWGYLDGMGTYNFSRSSSFVSMQIVGGFRWDHLDSKQSLRFSDTTGGNQLSGSTTNNVILNAFLPYLGFQYVYKSGTSNTTTRLIGFPYVPGSVKFQDSFSQIQTGLTSNGGGEYQYPLSFTSGYFLEFIAEGSRRMLGSAYLGTFFRWNMLHAATGPGSYTTASDRTDSFVIDEKFSYYIHAWTVGALVSLDF
ncbi:MAG: hypothetical protein ACLQPD_31285 [Desulfomonilaceae bacterium]